MHSKKFLVWAWSICCDTDHLKTDAFQLPNIFPNNWEKEVSSHIFSSKVSIQKFEFKEDASYHQHQDMFGYRRMFFVILAISLKFQKLVIDIPKTDESHNFPCVFVINKVFFHFHLINY